MGICNWSSKVKLVFRNNFSIYTFRRLVLWEAQFGDFWNQAEVSVDTLVTCGEAKWGLQSSVLMLLPHGYDGAGPEHSSSRVERLLQMTDSYEEGVDPDNINFQVWNFCDFCLIFAGYLAINGGSVFPSSETSNGQKLSKTWSCSYAKNITPIFGCFVHCRWNGTWHQFPDCYWWPFW